MPFNEESWSFFDRSPKHPEFRIGDYCTIEKDGARQLAYISGMNAPSVTGAPWQLDIEMLAGDQMRVPDSTVKRFTHNEASLADVIRLGLWSVLSSPASRNSIAKLSDEALVQFFVNLCSDAGRFLDLHPDHVARNIPKVRPSSPTEKQVLAVSRFLAEYGLNFYDCYRKEMEKKWQGRKEQEKKEETVSPFPIFGAVYPSLSGNDVAVTKLEFTNNVAVGKNPVTTLDRILVTFVSVNTGRQYQETARKFFENVRNTPDLTALNNIASVEKLPIWQKDEASEKKEASPFINPSWLSKKTYKTKTCDKYFVVLDFHHDIDAKLHRVIYSIIRADGIPRGLYCLPAEEFCKLVLPEPVDGAQEYRVMPIDTQPIDFSEDVIVGNVYKSSCVNEPLVVEKVFFNLQVSRWLVLVRSLADTNPERMQVFTVKELLQVGSNGQRHYTRVAKNVIEYFENVRALEQKCQK